MADPARAPKRNPRLPERYDLDRPITVSTGRRDAPGPKAAGGGAARRGTRRPGPDRRTSGLRRRHRLLAVSLVPGLLVLFLLWSVLGAVTTPGNQSLSAKWADWMRIHHAAFAITAAERLYFSLHTPPKGGRPKHLNALPAPSRSTTPTTAAGAGARPARHHAPRVPPHLPAPRPVPLVVHPALPHEGQWRPVGPRVDGIPGMYEAQFRADTVYTGEITSAVWIDPKLLRVSLVPGQTEPGGRWSIPPYITRAQRPRIEAAFNGGFLFNDAHGGFYLDGRTAVPLVRGAASLVIYRNGAVNVGVWGRDVHMTPQVVAVLQNLVPMVDHGRVSSKATYGDSSEWGATLGAAPVVARSGVGVTRDGALVFVAGPALTARSLAESLQRAGAVRAMTLDMNPEWVTFNFFGHPDPANPAVLKASSLYPQQQRPATRYLGPTKEARDFFTVSLPPGKHR